MRLPAADSAATVPGSVERALYFHARYLGLDEGGSCIINRDFEALLMDAPVMSAYAQLVNAGFPSRPVLEALQQGGRIPEDADLDELELKWLMGWALDQTLPATGAEDEQRRGDEPSGSGGTVPQALAG